MKIALILATITLLEITARAQPNAEDLYTQGQAAYERADYAIAIAKWQASYDLSKEAGLLFNLAQAKRLANDCVGAIATYRRFDEADTDVTSDQHKLAKDFVRELEGTCPQSLPIVTTPLTTKPTVKEEPQVPRLPPDHDQAGRSWKIAGVVTGGVGIMTIAVGLGLGHHGATIGDEITAACTTNCDWTVLKDKEARGKRFVTIGRTLDVVGVAAIAGGAIFYYLGVRKDETLTIAPAPGGGGVVSWSGAW
jgi:hypothetical protein